MTFGSALCRAFLGTAAIAFGLVFALQEADAILRYDPTTMSCATIKSTVRAKGAVMFYWRSQRTGNPLYGRYVANRNHCELYEVTTTKTVPASDRKNCSVLKCIPRSFVDDDDLCLFGRC